MPPSSSESSTSSPPKDKKRPTHSRSNDDLKRWTQMVQRSELPLNLSGSHDEMPDPSSSASDSSHHPAQEKRTRGYAQSAQTIPKPPESSPPPTPQVSPSTSPTHKGHSFLGHLFHRRNSKEPEGQPPSKL